MNLRALLARCLLALLLVLAQQQALVHELQHAAEAPHSQPASALHDACLQCLSLAGTDGAAVPARVEVAALDPRHTEAAASRPAPRPRGPSLAYRSRAPPTCS